MGDPNTNNVISENVTINEEDETRMNIPTTVSGKPGPKSTPMFAESTSVHKTLHSTDCQASPVARMSNSPHHHPTPSVAPNIPLLIMNRSSNTNSSGFHGVSKFGFHEERTITGVSNKFPGVTISVH